MVAWVLADAVLERFGGDSTDALVSRTAEMRDRLRSRFGPTPDTASE
jgi:hypothetical protein